MLQEIIENKKEEVAREKRQFPKLRNIPKSKNNYIKAITSEKISIIAEIKPKSPSKGSLAQDRDFSQVIDAYNRHAQAISVLTDHKYFDGSLELFYTVRTQTDLPMLRKDFIIDEHQIEKARLFGADAVLLIARALCKEQLADLQACARHYNMAAQVEVDSIAGLNIALATGANLIGINNRNLKSLQTDLQTTIHLGEYVPVHIPVVSESGIYTAQDVKRLTPFCKAILVGSAFMTAPSIDQKFQELKKGIDEGKTVNDGGYREIIC